MKFYALKPPRFLGVIIKGVLAALGKNK